MEAGSVRKVDVPATIFTHDLRLEYLLELVVCLCSEVLIGKLNDDCERKEINQAVSDLFVGLQVVKVHALAEEADEYLHEANPPGEARRQELIRVVVGEVHKLHAPLEVGDALQVKSDRAGEARDQYLEVVVCVQSGIIASVSSLETHRNHHQELKDEDDHDEVELAVKLLTINLILFDVLLVEAQISE